MKIIKLLFSLRKQVVLLFSAFKVGGARRSWYPLIVSFICISSPLVGDTVGERVVSLHPPTHPLRAKKRPHSAGGWTGHCKGQIGISRLSAVCIRFGSKLFSSFKTSKRKN